MNTWLLHIHFTNFLSVGNAIKFLEKNLKKFQLHKVKNMFNPWKSYLFINYLTVNIFIC